MWNGKSFLDSTVMTADVLVWKLMMRYRIYKECGGTSGDNYRYQWKKDSAKLVKLFHIFGLGNPFVT